MRRREQERYRGLLEQKRSELMQRVREALAGAGESGEGAPDLGDRALTTTSQEMLLQLSAGERRILKLIDEALGRIETGNYGTCVHCGGTIQKARLEAIPWARHCIECQELQDRGEI
jgi:DnaK suppressor protein